MSALVLFTARLFDRALEKVMHLHLGMVALLLGAGLSVWMVQGWRGGQAVVSPAGGMTASIEAPPVEMGPSGFPLPRFLSLKADKVNVRKGPSSEHAVAWVFQRKGMPVEVIAEFENWRKIRDSSGAEGWILQQMLSGRRFAMVPDWHKDKSVVLRERDSDKSRAVVRLGPGVVAQVDSCSSNWCYLITDDYEGYAHQTDLWGVYPDEVVN